MLLWEHGGEKGRGGSLWGCAGWSPRTTLTPKRCPGRFCWDLPMNLYSMFFSSVGFPLKPSKYGYPQKKDTHFMLPRKFANSEPGWNLPCPSREKCAPVQRRIIFFEQLPWMCTLSFVCTPARVCVCVCIYTIMYIVYIYIYGYVYSVYIELCSHCVYEKKKTYIYIYTHFTRPYSN